MGLYIKGMEMAKSCLSCPLQGGPADCRLTQKTYNWGLSERPSDCPLVPVPPHGRLIDADALIRGLTLDDEDDNSGASLLMAIFLEVLKAAPTIVEAEEE